MRLEISLNNKQEKIIYNFSDNWYTLVTPFLIDSKMYQTIILINRTDLLINNSEILFLFHYLKSLNKNDINDISIYDNKTYSFKNIYQISEIFPLSHERLSVSSKQRGYQYSFIDFQYIQDSPLNQFFHDGLALIFVFDELNKIGE